jgi:hypothetical protein
VLLAFAGLLAALAAVLAGFGERGLAVGLSFGASGACALTGLALLAAGRRAPDSDPDVVRPLPDLSPSTTALALGLVAIVLGVVFDLFLILIGAGVAVLGVVGLVRETRSQRREARRMGAA